MKILPDLWKNYQNEIEVSEVSLDDRVQTGKEIYRIAKKYYRDLGRLTDTTLKKFFNYIREIPYVEDRYGEEIIARPLYLLNPNIFPGLDCKKRAVLFGAWAEAHSIPWRLIAISERNSKEIHHVFPQYLLPAGENDLSEPGRKFIKVDGVPFTWKTLDATYPEYTLFMPKMYATEAEELPK